MPLAQILVSEGTGWTIYPRHITASLNFFSTIYVSPAIPHRILQKQSRNQPLSIRHWQNPLFSFRHYIKMPNQECSLTNLPYPNWCRRRESNPCPKHIIAFTFFTQQIDSADSPNNQTLVSFIGYAERLSDTYLGCKDYTRLHHLFLGLNKKPSFYFYPTN